MAWKGAGRRGVLERQQEARGVASSPRWRADADGRDGNRGLRVARPASTFFAQQPPETSLKLAQLSEYRLKFIVKLLITKNEACIIGTELTDFYAHRMHRNVSGLCKMGWSQTHSDATICHHYCARLPDTECFY